VDLFQAVLAALQRCLLEFRQQSHQPEAGQHSLQTQLLQSVQRHNEDIETVDDDDLCLHQVTAAVFPVEN